jgi:short subunit dehydrogenase-like uncharacterized protein
MRDGAWMIYGANGYTGNLIAQEARRCGLQAIVAGRNGAAISRLGNRLNFETRVFALDNPDVVAENLSGVAVVLHCAGPFSATSAPMLEGCKRSGTNYLDITGEIDVFEAAHARHDEWVRAGITVVPGVAMDVMPTDCLAAMLHSALPDATLLTLAIASRKGTLSPGTAKTVVEGLGHGCRIRREGRIESIPIASKTRDIPFGVKPERAVCMPWGDVATAYYTTGIPNIEVYFRMSEKQIRSMQWLGKVGWVARMGPVQGLLKKLVEKRVTGPSDEERAADEVLVYGEVSNPAGDTVVQRMRLPEGYTFSALSALSAVQHVLKENLDPGYYTPSQAFGHAFVLHLEGVRLE